MKTIKITENALRKIILESIHNLFEDNPTFQELKGIEHGETINVGELSWITDRESFNNYAPQMYEMLYTSYENIGGLKSYNNYNEFLRRRHSAKIVVKNNELLACATYRKIENSFKLIAIGCNQTTQGKIAMQQIIQDDIIHYDLGFWAEVSGAIEHYFKKFNGFPIPNFYAVRVLNELHFDAKPIADDNVHYKRIIGNDGDVYTKMLFGFKSESDFNNMLNDIDDYTGFMERVNSVNEGVSLQKYTYKQCVYIIDNIITLHDEKGFNELLPKWHQALLDCLESLNNIENKDELVWDYMENAEYLLDTMPVLELHKL